MGEIDLKREVELRRFFRKVKQLNLLDENPEKILLRFLNRVRARVDAGKKSESRGVHQSARGLEMKLENHAGRLAHFDATREKIDSGLQASETNASRFGDCGVNWDRNLGITQIDRVKGGFLLEQIGVIDVKGEIADLGEDRLPAIVIVNLEILGN